MKKFELVFLVLFLQIGFVLTGLVEIVPGTQMKTVYVDASLMGSLTGLGNSANTFNAKMQSIQSNGVFAPQQFQFCTPLINVSGFGQTIYVKQSCTPAVSIPAYAAITTIEPVVNALINIGLLILAIGINATILSGNFYTAIILSILPKSVTTIVFAVTVGYMLGLLQVIVLLIDLFRSWRGGSVGTTNSLNFNFEDWFK